MARSRLHLTRGKPGITPTAMPRRSNAPLLLGVDAGGTHTVAIAVRADGSQLVRHEFGPANLYLLSDRELASHLRSIARAVGQPDAVAVGMAGARTPADHARVRAAAGRAWPGVPVRATSDLATSLAAASMPVDNGVPTGGRRTRQASTPAARVLIVSGTGSCCFAETPDGRTARLGGWGHVLGDRGSGYDIAVQALRAVVLAGDHVGRWPPLGRRLLRALLLNEPEDLVTWVASAAKPDVAALTPEVLDAYSERDPIAVRVVRAAAERLALDAVGCAAKVAKASGPVEFVMAGSVLLKSERFASLVARAVRSRRPGARVFRLQRESVWGAVELARDLLAAQPAKGARAFASTTPPPSPVPVPPLESLAASPTERRNPRSAHLDRLSVQDAVDLMLDEDRRVPDALVAARRSIARGVTLVARAFKRGGRLFYVGAGTSGRLGVLDASECPPTFRSPADQVQGIIAGGQRALWSAVEGAEDDALAGTRAIAGRGVGGNDVVVGIAASGRTPFVWGALHEARRRHATTILLCFNPGVVARRGHRPDLVIAPDVGPEVLTGSTRLKAGTATKLVLNILTTLAMVQLGKVRSNLMIDVRASNGKLRDRAVRIVRELTGVEDAVARAALEATRWRIPDACRRLPRTRQ